MMKKTILTLLITLCPFLAFASDYIYLGSSGVNTIYVNNDITPNDGKYRAWVSSPIKIQKLVLLTESITPKD